MTHPQTAPPQDGRGPAHRTAQVWGGRLDLHFRVLGGGPDLVYFPSVGTPADDPLVARLAEDHTVHVVEFPGTSAGDPYAVHVLDDLWDVVLAHEEALRTAGLTGVPAIGHGFGGMLAAELAATFPGLFTRLVLIAPIGLWEDDAPVADWLSVPAEELPGLLFATPPQPGPAPAEDPRAAVEAAVAAIWAMGCAGKFVWPIPDKGLAGRLHRVTTPTLLLWGEDDRLNPVRYAKRFADRIGGDTTVTTFPDCGHSPQWELTAPTHRAVGAFLDEGENRTP
jgi:pimeloyl-ACP methyl ester carboxylesterase